MPSPNKPNSSALFEEALRYSKALKPLTPAEFTELARLSSLDVSTYTESDVRAEIIDPVVKILGYQKETNFSVKREKHLKILDTDVYIDYSMLLFEENFWVIEAKRVKRKELKFIDKEVLQALQYAAHPDINAALLVLCDGRLFEVYDRDESLATPVARVEVKNLAAEFDVLRGFLSPWQAWFFQKRRVLRMIDKVFDLEMNMRRLEEFRYDVTRRLIDKRATVLRNYQRLAIWKADSEKSTAHLRSADTRELVDLHFFLNRTAGDIQTTSQTLVDRAKPGAFDVFYPIFPDHPRDTNDDYWASALHFLLTFEASGKEVGWLPSFLGAYRDGTKVADAAGKLIALCLDTFDQDLARKAVLQYSASARRVAKILLVRVPSLLQNGKLTHLLIRRTVDELDLAQFMSTPEGHNLRQLDEIQYRLTARFCQDCTGEKEGFRTQVALQKLKEQWRIERGLLGDGREYHAAVEAADLGEMNSSESPWVVYDRLGHSCLCIIAMFPKWRDAVMEHHRSSVERIARHGSWQARELLGQSIDDPYTPPSIGECATRFFSGDLELCRALVESYGFVRSLQPQATRTEGAAPVAKDL